MWENLPLSVFLSIIFNDLSAKWKVHTAELYNESVVYIRIYVVLIKYQRYLLRFVKTGEKTQSFTELGGFPGER